MPAQRQHTLQTLSHLLQPLKSSLRPTQAATRLPDDPTKKDEFFLSQILSTAHSSRILIALSIQGDEDGQVTPQTHADQRTKTLWDLKFATRALQQHIDNDTLRSCDWQLLHHELASSFVIHNKDADAESVTNIASTLQIPEQRGKADEYFVAPANSLIEAEYSLQRSIKSLHNCHLNWEAVDAYRGALEEYRKAIEQYESRQAVWLINHSQDTYPGDISIDSLDDTQTAFRGRLNRIKRGLVLRSSLARVPTPTAVGDIELTNLESVTTSLGAAAFPIAGFSAPPDGEIDIVDAVSFLQPKASRD